MIFFFNFPFLSIRPQYPTPHPRLAGLTSFVKKKYHLTIDHPFKLHYEFCRGLKCAKVDRRATDEQHTPSVMPAKFSAYDTLMEYPSSGTLKVRYTQSQKWKAKFRASNGTEYLKKKK